jgi:opacity protein-like surface antigen
MSIRTAGLAGVVLAACMAPDGARPQDLHASVTLYGWLPGLDAEVTSSSGGISASTSVSASNVLKALNFALMAAGEVHYGRLGVIQDLVYADLGTSGNLSGPLASKVNVDTNMLISTTAIGYRAYEQGGWLVEPFAGARYVDLEQGVKITGGGPLGVERAASVDLNWWDPVIGLRGRAPITESLSAAGFVDIGGFGVGSEFSWEIYAGLDYAFTDSVSAVAGFRYLSINYDQGRAELKLDTYGPVLGATFRF